ncbi:hypothetical protein As57867_010212, partial [Aphanomyces stellatus]
MPSFGPVWTTLLLAATALVSAQQTTQPCTEASMASVTAVPLGTGPMTIKTTVSGSRACIQVAIDASKNAKWVSISIAHGATMVTSPRSNAVIFDTTQPTKLNLVSLGGYSSSTITPESTQSAVSFVASSIINGKSSFTFSRATAAVATADVAIGAGPTNINWAYGASSNWPSIHDERGSSTVVFGSSAVLAAPDTHVTTYTTAIAAIALGIMIVLGLIATHTGHWRVINQATLFGPPASKLPAPIADVIESVADIKIGEYIVIGVYGACLAVVSASVRRQFAGEPNARLLRLLSGHLALVGLMFLLLPVARGQHWEWIFGISHERIIKFHRMLGRFVVVASTIHLILTLQVTRVDNKTVFGTQSVVPLFGFVAFVSFASMGLLAVPVVRRHCYELFYYHHRVASVVGVVFVMLHSRTACVAMIFPVAIYGLTF